MIYITDDDLKTDAQERYITDSTADNQESPDKIELRVIDLCKSYMTGLFDIDKIFDPANPVRNELLVDIISKITLYRVFKRNSIRKVTQSIKDDYDWAMKELDKIGAGRTPLNGLPKPVVDPGQPDNEIMWGNNSNPDFYI